jgi:hypothetical protein
MLNDFVNNNRAWIRSVVQAAWAMAASWAPVQWILDTGGWAISSDNVEALVFVFTFGLIRFVGGWLEKRPEVTGNTMLRHIVGIVMGGETPPEYQRNAIEVDGTPVE